MKHLAFLAVLVALISIFATPMADGDVVVRPHWAAEQLDGQVYWYYYWRGQKYYVDPAGQHWAILATGSTPVDNRFVPCMAGPVRQAAACPLGRLFIDLCTANEPRPTSGRPANALSRLTGRVILPANTNNLRERRVVDRYTAGCSLVARKRSYHVYQGHRACILIPEQHRSGASRVDIASSRETD